MLNELRHENFSWKITCLLKLKTCQIQLKLGKKTHAFKGLRFSTTFLFTNFSLQCKTRTPENSNMTGLMRKNKALILYFAT